MERCAVTRCPVCSCESTQTIHRFSPEQAAQHFVLREASPKRNRELASYIAGLWGGGDCAVRQCDHCGFGFADPYVSGDVKFYNLAFDRTRYPGDKWEFRRTLAELSSMSFCGARVLGAGSGVGLFLDKIVDKYVPRSGVVALEFSDTAIKVLHQKGYIALQEDLRNAGLVGHFDAIFMFQVVEHMDRLDSLFANVSRLLRDHGLLFIAVPNPRFIAFNEQYGSLLDMPPNHIGRWTPAAFQILGTRHGLRLDRHEIEPFSLGPFIIRDIADSYIRRSQSAGTFENWSRRYRLSKYGRLIEGATAAVAAPCRMNVWRRAASTRDVGNSLWAKFSKAE
jgi:SAM-dependent methyltransferase